MTTSVNVSESKSTKRCVFLGSLRRCRNLSERILLSQVYLALDDNKDVEKVAFQEKGRMFYVRRGVTSKTLLAEFDKQS